MKSDTPLDYAVFQLSPKRSRCELLVSSDGNSEKLASGLLKPFVTHLKVAEEQVAMSVHSIKLEIERHKNTDLWFTKGTLERFVRFVTTPEILELVNTYEAEMSQLESARRIYSQGSEDQHSAAGGGGSGVTAAADATKKELLRAIDVRLVAVEQDLTRAYARASAAGFTSDTVPELQMFADRFGAQRLNEACSKYISLCKRRHDLISQWKAVTEDRTVRSSYGSDMSIDEEPTTPDSGSQQHPRHDQPTGRAAIANQTPQQQEENTNQSQPSTFQQPATSFSFQRISRESSMEPDDALKPQDDRETSTPATSADQVESIQASQPARRLSVQDRVKLFENKQKESSGSGGRPAVGKSVELRRLSSDVSSAPAAVEKAVLRRWSGASDMSIDLSCEKKDTESPLCTPSSSSVSQLKFEERKDTANSIKPESRNFSKRTDDKGFKDQGESGLPYGEDEVAGPKQLTVSSGKQEDASEGEKSSSSSGTVETDVWRDQVHGKAQPRTFLNRTGINSAKDQVNSGAQIGSLSDGKSQPKSKAFDPREEQAIGQVAFEAQVAGQRDKGAPQSQFGMTANKVRGIKSAVNLHQPGQDEFSYQSEDTRLGDQLSELTHFKAPQKPLRDSAPPGGASGSRIREAFAAQYKGTEGNSSFSQPMSRSFLETEGIQKKELAFGEKLSGSSALKFEDSGPQRVKFDRQATASEQLNKGQGRRKDSTPVYENNKTIIPGKLVNENLEDFASFSTPPADHVQRVRQSKANQERNDELKMKANELEKLFAEHKLRVPGDQSNSTRRSRPIDRQGEPSESQSSKKTPAADSASCYVVDDRQLTEPAGSSKTASRFTEFPPLKMVDTQNYSDALNTNFSELSFSEGYRGKFYERYMQKRDAKLREDWSSRGAEKEAKLKFLQDSLDQSRAEMKAKFSGSTGRQDSVSNSQRRAERLRSFNARSIMRREQQQLDFGQVDNDEDINDFPDQNYNVEVGSLNETSLVDGLSRSAQSKKLFPAKGLSSSTPRTPAAPIPKAATRASNISSGRRKVHSENPLAQSVPNFSELRKENTKPYSAANRTARQQTRNYSRSKSGSEEISFVREEKSRRPQSLRKSSATPVESRDLSPENFDETEEIPYDRYTKTLGPKTIPKKDSGTEFGARSSVGLRKTTRAEATNDEAEYDDLAFGLEDPVDQVKDEDEEFETVANVHNSNMENGEPELDQESEKVDFGLENGALRSFPHEDSSFAAELPAVVPPSDNVQDSPGESPVSWNSRTHHPFSYSHEMSDIDASVDSPVGSPASWNSHSLSQAETDASRMRKKWGTAQKPMLVVNSSNNQSRKDMTRGFKRLLKFGRKSRGTESLVDWISATTSEGDDDTEDGREPTYRTSEDLRKSRMGSLQGHPSDDSFNDGEFYGEQVQSLRSSIPAPPANFKLREDHLSGSSIKAPRSFFSLSSFRSKASDSKPR